MPDWVSCLFLSKVSYLSSQTNLQRVTMADETAQSDVVCAEMYPLSRHWPVSWLPTPLLTVLVCPLYFVFSLWLVICRSENNNQKRSVTNPNPKNGNKGSDDFFCYAVHDSMCQAPLSLPRRPGHSSRQLLSAVIIKQLWGKRALSPMFRLAWTSLSGERQRRSWGMCRKSQSRCQNT